MSTLNYNTATTFSTSSPFNISSIQLDTNKFVIGFTDTSGKIKLQIVTNTNGTLSFGTLKDTNIYGQIQNVVNDGTTKFCISYLNGDRAGLLICSESSGVITTGTNYYKEYGDYSFSFNSCQVVILTSSIYVLTESSNYKNSEEEETQYRNTAYFLNVSGLNVTSQASQKDLPMYALGIMSDYTKAFRINDTQFLYSYRNWNGDIIEYCVVSSTATGTVFQSNTGGLKLIQLNGTKYLNLYAGASSSVRGKIINITGTTVSQGSEVILASSGLSAYGIFGIAISETSVILSYAENSFNTMQSKELLINGNNITNASPATLAFSAVNYYNDLCRLSATEFAIVYRSGTTGYIKVGTIVNGKKINGITYAKWNGGTITKWNNQ